MSQLTVSPADAPIFSPAASTPRAAPRWVVPELYERLTQSLRLADAALDADDGVERDRHLREANTIAFALIASVDLQPDGELGPRLSALYGYFASEILVIGRTSERSRVAQLIDMVQVLSGACRHESEPAGAPRGEVADVVQP